MTALHNQSELEPPPYLREGRDHEPPKTPPDDDKFADEDWNYVSGRDGHWLVKGLWPRVGVCFVVGPSTGGKSFLTLDLMSRVARGEPVLGLRSISAGVVYIAAEGAAGVRRRIEGLREATGMWSENTRFIGRAPDLTDQADVDRLVVRLVKIRDDFRSRGIRLGAVVVDTMSASIPGADENAAKEMSPILTRLQELAATLDLCVIVVAHVGKDADRGIRGWSGMFANADGVVRVMPHDEDELRIVTVQKAKDAEAGQRHAFALRVVDLGADSDGDPVTTCVVDWQDSAPSARKPGKRARTDQHPNRTAILTAFARLEDHRRLKPLDGLSAPAGARGADLKELMEAAFDAGLGGPEPEASAEVKRWKDNRRKGFHNHVGYAVQAGVLAQEKGLVWRCPT